MTKRLHLVCDLSTFSPVVHADPSEFAHPDVSAPEALGSLLFEAYRGGVEQEEEAPEEGTEEIRRTFSGEYGPLVLDASFVLSDAHGVVGACLIVDHRGDLLLAHAIVHPRARGLGLGTRLITASMLALRAKGARSLHLAVHPENTAAARLYARLGFVEWHEVSTAVAVPKENEA